MDQPDNTAVSAVVFLPAGFFMTGTSAKLAVGTPIKAFTDEDVPLAMAAAGPLPLAVAAPVAVKANVPADPAPSSRAAVLETISTRPRH